MIKYQPNPLNTFGLRELAHCPPHFFVVDFNLAGPEKHIRDWIWENLRGRFFFGDVYVRAPAAVLPYDIVPNISPQQGSVLQKRAGFEIHSEGSYFAMFLPDLNKF